MPSLELAGVAPLEEVATLVPDELFVGSSLGWVLCAAVVDVAAVEVIAVETPDCADVLVAVSSPVDEAAFSLVFVACVVDSAHSCVFVHAESASRLGELAEHEALTTKSETAPKFGRRRLVLGWLQVG